MNSFTTTLKGAIDRSEGIQDALQESQARIAEFEGRIKEFNSKSAHLKQCISAHLPVYWDRVHTPFQGTQSKTIQGFLWKKCGRFPVRWERRFFIVSNCILSYSDEVEQIAEKPRNVSLLFASVRPDPTAARPHCFTIQTKERSYTLQALTEWEMNRWLAVIQNNILSSLNANGADEDEPLEDETDTFVCADCGAVGAGWCSINWGVYLCNACCGVHRSFPPQSSRIRSLTLDTIDINLRTLIDAIGTEKANLVLEKNCPSEEKINPNTDKEQREVFIKKKYADRAYVDSEPVSIEEAIQNEDLMSVYKYIAQRNLKITENTFTPLHMAAIVGNPIIFQLILLHSSNIDVIDDCGLTAFSYAAAYSNIPIIDILLIAGANPVIGNAYQIAKACKQEEVMKKLESKSEGYEIESFDIPHQEFKPKIFNKSKYIDPNVSALRAKPRRSVSKINEKDKLMIAIGSLHKTRSSQTIPHVSLPPPDQ